MKRLAIAALALLALPAIATAKPPFPQGQWEMRFFMEKPTAGATGTQGICFNADGTWYSPTFPAWDGFWYMKGNDVHMQGNYASGAGNDAIELTRISGTLITGYWQEWRDDYSTLAYLTARFFYTKDVCDPPLAPSTDSGGNPAGK